MNPLAALWEVTRMLTPYWEQFGSPYEVVPTTFCWLCATPAGRSAGPPLSPSHGPPTPPPSLYWKTLAETDWLTGALACMRVVLFWLFCVVPKPTYSTLVPTARP